jgi:hypothetical protein
VPWKPGTNGLPNAWIEKAIVLKIVSTEKETELTTGSIVKVIG